MARDLVGNHLNSFVVLCHPVDRKHTASDHFVSTHLWTRLATAASTAAVASASIGMTSTGMDLDLHVDPKEPTYCICNQVSYGEMIACDNNECTIEWFHFGCVGLKDQPKGKWYCPDCATVKKSRKGR
ncbi:PHD finger protein ING1-like [Raphanus sativus]|uniref:PHD finger protein ING1-like n=1 Tax=Raphanus sativus TaxID=3726 RepID=A0A6J0NQ81_RAPSA|nr:PHD finger protein ING1-like [Raphanus sativus]